MNAPRPLDGIHHISAITGDAQANLDFYARVLGLRLIAKSVNQDDPTVYHLFYGDENARPGLDMTFFEYPHAMPGRAGAGEIYRIVWRVASADALDFWQQRLAVEGIETDRDRHRILFVDREGLNHELAVDGSGDPPLIADHPEIPAEFAIQGFEGVRAYSHRPEHSVNLLEELMGAEPIATPRGGAWELRGERRGGWIAFDEPPEAAGRQGAGSVHHIAWGTTDHDLPDWIERVTVNRIPSSGHVDRHYFHSLYFREPGGILYELATLEPGFTVDGLPIEELGTKVILPPRFEPMREQIEERLTPLTDPRSGWDRPARSRATAD